MNRIFFLIAFAIIFVSGSMAYSQVSQNKNTSSFGAKVLVGISNQTDYEESIGLILSYSIGAVYTHQINNSFSLQVEGLYSVKGSELDSYNGFYFNYFDVPILVKLSLSSSLKNKVNLYVGIQPSLFLNGTVKFEGNKYDAHNVTSPDFAIPFGVDFQLGNNIYIELRYNLGLTSIAKDSDIKNTSLLGGFTFYFN